MLNSQYNQHLFIAYLKHHQIDLDSLQKAAMLKYFKDNEGWSDIVCNQFTTSNLLANPQKIQENWFITLLTNKDDTPEPLIHNVIHNDIEKKKFFSQPLKAQEYINLVYSMNEAKETYDAVKEFLEVKQDNLSIKFKSEELAKAAKEFFQNCQLQDKINEIKQLMIKSDKTEKEERIYQFLKSKSSLKKISENYKNSVRLVCDKQKEIQCDKQYLQDIIVYFKNNLSQSNVLTDYFQYTLLVLFKIFPDSPLSYSEQKDLNSMNEERSSATFFKALSTMKSGDYFRIFFAEKKYGILTTGHSTLVYKNQDGTFTFFNPGNGIETKLSKEDILTRVIDLRKAKMKAWNTEVNIGIMDNKKFLEKNHSKRIEEIKSFIEKQKENNHYLAKL